MFFINSFEQPVHGEAWAAATDGETEKQPRETESGDGGEGRGQERAVRNTPTHACTALSEHKKNDAKRHHTKARGAYLEELVNLGQELCIHGQTAPHVRVGSSSVALTKGGREGGMGGGRRGEKGVRIVGVSPAP